jgi:endonuclease/exonuclease/phosphatase family metal-dependent hydrolase
MRFLSFNIRYDNPADGLDAWPHRISAVAELIARYRPDAFGLQEAKRHQVEDLERALGSVPDLGYAWFGVGRDDGREGGEYNPIFYRRSVLDLQESGTFWLSDSPDEPGSRFEGTTLPRICTWGRFQRAGEKPFLFFTTHFDYLSPAAQEKSAALLLTRVPTHAGLYPSVLVGDFNCTSSSGAYRLLVSSFFKDAREAAAALPAERNVNAGAGTFTDFRSPAEAGVVLAGEEVIDHAFTSGFVIERREVVLDVREDNGRSISDHRALVIDAAIVGAAENRPEAAPAR